MSHDELKRLHEEIERICEGPDRLLDDLRDGVFPKATFMRFEKKVREYRDLLRKHPKMDRSMAGLLYSIQFSLAMTLQKSHEADSTSKETKLIVETWDRFEGLMADIYYGD